MLLCSLEEVILSDGHFWIRQQSPISTPNYLNYTFNFKFCECKWQAYIYLMSFFIMCWEEDHILDFIALNVFPVLCLL